MGDFNPQSKHEPFKVEVQEGSKPSYNKPYRLGPQISEALHKQLQELLRKGYIIPSSSEFGAPVMMVPKPHQPDKFRLVIDYRQLNRITIKDKYNMSNAEDLITHTAGSKVYSVLDALWGFWQIPTDPATRHRLAMSTPFGSYEWCCMPMGTSNSPPHFQRVMNNYLGHLPFVKVFVDDILVHSNTVEEHAQHLTQVFDILLEKGVVIKSSKMALFKKSVKFLGHVLTGTGISMQQSKVKVIEEWPDLKDATDVKSFLGLCNFYRKYVNNFAHKAVPLNNLLKKDVEFKWGEDEKASFQALKNSITQAPVLILPDHGKARSGEAPFIIQTDASGFAVGGVLMQNLNKEFGPQPIMFESKSLNAAQQNWHTTDRELGALVHCTNQWKHLLIGAKLQIQGDHKPLASLFSPTKELSRRQARWIEHLTEVGVSEIEHIPGITLTVPDALSRRSDYPIHTPREGADMAAKHPQGGDDIYLKDRSFPFETLNMIYAEEQEVVNIVNNMVHYTTKNSQHEVYHLLDSLQPMILQPPECKTASTREARQYKRTTDMSKEYSLSNNQYEYWKGRIGPFTHQHHTSDKYTLSERVALWKNNTVYCVTTGSDQDHINELVETAMRARNQSGLTNVLFVIPRDVTKKLTPGFLKKNNMDTLHVYPSGSFVLQTKTEKEVMTPTELSVIWAKPLVAPIMPNPVTDRQNTTADEQISLPNIKQLYPRDPELMELKAKLAEAPHGMANGFKLTGDLVWRTVGGQYQLCVPAVTELVEAIMHQCHDSPVAGHLGTKKTAEKVLRRFWWHGATGQGPLSIQHYCESCPTCQMAKHSNRKTRIVNPHAIPSRPFEVVAIDFVTGLPLTTVGYSAIMTVTCKLTKMVRLIPLNWQSSSARDVYNLYMQNVWRLRGSPLKVVCDNDTRFNDWFKQLLKLFGTKVATTTAYNPQSDGQSEVTNKLVETLLTAYVNAEQTDWDQWLYLIEYAINDSEHSVTGVTPFVAAHGHSPLSTIDLLVETIKNTSRSEMDSNAVTTAERISSTLTDIKTKLRNKLKETLAEQDAQFRQKPIPVYKEQDQVLLHLGNITQPSEYANQHKLRVRWGGPFVILKVHYSDARREAGAKPIPSAYTLSLPPHWDIHPTFTPDKLKRFKTSDSFPSRYVPAATPIQMVEGQEEHVVERIMRSRWIKLPSGTKQQWLIKWAGYSAAYATWEDYEAINTGGTNVSWKSFQTNVLQQEKLLRDRVRKMQKYSNGKNKLTQMLLDRITDLPEQTNTSFLDSTQLLMLESTQNACTHVMGRNKPIPIVTDIKAAPFKVLMLGDNPRVEQMLHTLLGSQSVIVTVGNNPTCTHYTSIPQWMTPHSNSEAKPESLHQMYGTVENPCYFDLVWITPTKVEKRGGKGPSLAKNAVVEPALQYLNTEKTPYFVLDTFPSTMNEMCETLGWNTKGQMYPLQKKQAIITNIPVKSIKPEYSLHKRVQKLVPAALTNQQCVLGCV